MSKSRIIVSTKNFKEFADLLNALPGAVGDRVIPKALGAAAKPIASGVKARAPRKSGALKNSITSVVRKYSDGGAIAVIGPDRDYFQGGKRVKAGEDRRGADRPANYAHLVEDGHANRDGTRTEGRGFMRAGVAASETAAAAEFYREAADGIDSEQVKALAKLRKF